MKYNINNSEVTDAFVVTKPLQYINVLNIKNSNKKTLLLVDLFMNSKIIFKKIKEKSIYWNEVYYIKNIDETFNWLIKNKNKIGTLYIDSDINHRKEFSLLRRLNITVYEEGVGTYRKKQYKPRRKFLGNLYLLLLRLQGYKNRRGGNKYTKNIVVYHPDFFKKYVKEKKKRILGFKKPFIEHLQTCKELEIFNLNINFSDIHKKTVALYLPGWNIDEKEIRVLNNTMCERKIIKPHPHSKKITEQYEFDMIVSAEIPAEILILNLIDIVSRLIIISKYSTSTIYFLNHPKVEVINIKNTPQQYNDSESYLEAYNNLGAYLKKQSGK